MPQAPALTPYPLDLLLGRVAREWESRQRIFDLPIARFWKKADGVDLSMDFLGDRRPPRSVRRRGRTARWRRTSCSAGWPVPASSN